MKHLFLKHVTLSRIKVSKMETFNLKNSILIICTFLSLAGCMYTGGLNLYTGREVRGKIVSKATEGGSLVSLLALTSSGSGTKCTSGDGGGTVEETEPNDTYKQANEVPFPSSGVTYIQGTFTALGEYDIYYMKPSSDLTGTYTIYYKYTSSNTSTCSIGVSTPEELTNDTIEGIYFVDTPGGGQFPSDSERSVEFDADSHYIFVKCDPTGDIEYEIQLTLKSNSDATSSQFSDSSIVSTIAGLVMLNSKLDMGKYYTRDSVEKCLSKLDTTIPIVSVINADLLIQAVVCGRDYFPLNEYGVAALTCDLEEASVIQLDSVGIPP